MATKSAKEKNRPLSRYRKVKPPTNTSADTSASKSEGSQEPTAGAVRTCENCNVESHPRKRHTTKKKPIYKVGSWQRAFAGTPDF